MNDSEKKRTNGLGMSTAIYLEGQAERAAEGRADHEDNTNNLHPCAFWFILRAGWAGRMGPSGRHIISMGWWWDAMRCDADGRTRRPGGTGGTRRGSVPYGTVPGHSGSQPAKQDSELTKAASQSRVPNHTLCSITMGNLEALIIISLTPNLPPSCD
ncbi:unnamed protein product [Calypogeia fissa]